MPELPEVETIRRGLVPLLLGRTITALTLHDDRLTRRGSADQVAQTAACARVTRLDRRGKYLIFHLENDSVLVHHLRMTGSFAYRAAGDGEPLPTHVRAIYTLDDGGVLAYRDVRRFGTLEAGPSPVVLGALNARLGPEPLDDAFTADVLWDQLRDRRTAIKAALLDQRVVAGVGNIYADEALFLAHIGPLRRARALSRDEVTRLHTAIVAVLSAGVAAQGSTLRDYATVTGSSGSMQEAFRVYGRQGMPCTRCSGVIQHLTVGGRTTASCNTCQKRSWLDLR